MKRIIAMLLFATTIGFSMAAAPVSLPEPNQSSSREVTFRATQKLRSSDGREIYLYRGGKCELYDGDRLEASCRYSVTDGEIRIYDDYGNSYKASYEADRQGGVSSLTLSGTTYRKK